MDNEHNNKSQDQNTERLKEIPKWIRKYAQNRTLTTLVLMVMIILMSMVIGVPLALTMTAFTRGNMILFWSCVAVSAAIFIFLIILVSKFGGKNRGLIDQKIDQWIYGKEGTASMPVPKLRKKKKCEEHTEKHYHYCKHENSQRSILCIFARPFRNFFEFFRILWNLILLFIHNIAPVLKVYFQLTRLRRGPQVAPGAKYF